MVVCQYLAPPSTLILATQEHCQCLHFHLFLQTIEKISIRQININPLLYAKSAVLCDHHFLTQVSEHGWTTSPYLLWPLWPLWPLLFPSNYGAQACKSLPCVKVVKQKSNLKYIWPFGPITMIQYHVNWWFWNYFHNIGEYIKAMYCDFNFYQSQRNSSQRFIADKILEICVNQASIHYIFVYWSASFTGMVVSLDW
jgi:hypothetical protein